MTNETKTAHTPGPWKWNRDFGKWELVRNGEQPTVLSCPHGRMRVHSSESGKPGKPTEVMTDLTPDHPDARLIAAAPDLLEALELFIRFFDEMPKGQFANVSCDIGLMNDAFLRSAAAITKATP